MRSTQIQLVRNSFAQIAPQADAVAASFYQQLFELDPKLRPMFKNDLTRQREMLMSVLAAGIHGLDRLDTIVPTLHALGARHAAYGVNDAHYDTVAQALLLTLAAKLGDAFTPQVGDAWVSAFTLLAGAMKAGASMAGAPTSMGA